MNEKPQKSQGLVLASRLPDLPRIPTAVLSRFPEMTDYQKSLDAFWAQARQTYARDLGEIVTEINALQPE